MSLMKPEQLLARIEVRSIDMGVFLEKRRMVLEEMDALGYCWTWDNRSRVKPRERDLRNKASRLETEIVRLEAAIRKDRAKLADLA